MPFWPQEPTPGGLVRLPLALPPMLCDAAGYTGSARCLAMRWTPYGDELIYTDGELTATGWWQAWTTLCQHELGRAVLGPYRLGSSDGEAEHWLLADRRSHTLDVGLALDVRQLLATQPSGLNAAAHILGAERTGELIEQHVRNPPSPDIDEIRAEMERRGALVSELERWLDEQLEAVETSRRPDGV
jgi:hypothetical protein